MKKMLASVRTSLLTTSESLNVCCLSIIFLLHHMCHDRQRVSRTAHCRPRTRFVCKFLNCFNDIFPTLHGIGLLWILQIVGLMASVAASLNILVNSQLKNKCPIVSYSLPHRTIGGMLSVSEFPWILVF